MNRFCDGRGCASSSRFQTTGFTSRPTCWLALFKAALSCGQSTFPTTKTSMSLPGSSRPEAYDPKMNARWSPRMSRRALRSEAAIPVAWRMTSRRAGTRGLSSATDHRRKLPRRRLWTSPAFSSCSSARWTGWASAATRRAISRVCSSCPGRLMSKPRTSLEIRPRPMTRSSTCGPYHDRCQIDHSRDRRDGRRG